MRFDDGIENSIFEVFYIFFRLFYNDENVGLGCFIIGRFIVN